MISCRLCGEKLERTFVDLGMSPLSNAFLREDQLLAMERFYPLKVFVCSACLLVQLPATERAETIFKDDYIYFSSYSTSWLEHCRAYAREITRELGLGAQSLVVEVASNDGYLLQYFREANVPVLGIEPSESVARVAIEERHIPTEVCFFGAATAARIGKKADLMIGNNVLAHVPDLHDFLEGFRIMLAPHGVITLEFPHLQKLIERNQFDTIYQEHYSYFSLATAKRALEAHGLRVFDVRELPTHGGSLRIHAAHASDQTHATKPSVARVLDAEKLDTIEAHLGFREQTNKVKRDLVAFLIEAKRAGKRVVGYGAPAKGNTMLNYCGIREDLLEFTVDRSPHKQGKYLPGTHIPVRRPEDLDAAKPDYVLVLPWNLRDEISTQLAYIKSWGGKLVFAVPSLEVL